MTYNTAKELLIQLQCCNPTITKEQVDAITLVISILDDLKEIEIRSSLIEEKGKKGMLYKCGE